MKNQTSPRLLVLGIIPCMLLLSFDMTISQGQKINRKRPSVYLTFRGFVPKTAEGMPASQGGRLVLHNNTQWPVYYGKWLEPTLPGDVPMIYNIEQANGCIEERRHTEVVETSKLMPGKTVSFVVPREDFPKGSNIFVRFWFSWEVSPEKGYGEEVEHRTYFYLRYLPNWP